MDTITLYNILVVIGACIFSIIMEAMLLPRIIYISKKKRLFDMPDQRKIHQYPIPRLGGVSFTPVILLVGFFCLFIRFKLDAWPNGPLLERVPEVLLLVCGLLMIYLLGVKDDLVGVGFKKKFLFQFIASLTIVGSGTYINNLYGLFGVNEIPDALGIVLSIGFITFATNAINLIDGADGLASGISLVALSAYGVMFALYGMWTYATFAFITIGILIPFFYYNFFHPTRKIFMGDTGSLTLGFLLAFMMLRLAKYPPALEIVPSGLIILILSALFIPLFDALKVMLLRIYLGKGPFSPDRNHIHHSLIDLGLSKRKVVFVILFASVIIIVLNWLLLDFGINPNIVLVIDLAIGVFSNVIIFRAIKIKSAFSSGNDVQNNIASDIVNDKIIK